MKSNAIYVRRARKVLLERGHGEQPVGVLAALLKDCAGLGFVLSPELLERVATLSDLEARGFKAFLEDVLRELVGAHVRYAPMYPDFPTQVMEADEAELFYNAVMHYMGDHLGVRVLPTYQAAPRAPLDEDVDLKVIDLGDAQDLREMARRLVASKVSLSKTDKEDLAVLLEAHADDLASVLPQRIEFKENLAFVTGTVMKLTSDTAGAVKLLTASYRSATDVLRLAVALSDGDVSLAAPTRFRSFKRVERRFLLGLLDGVPDMLEDMQRHAKRWIRLGERLHPGEYAGRYPTAHAGFLAVRRGQKTTTFNSRVEALLPQSARDLGARDELIALLKTRPGELARRLDDLLRDAQEPTAILRAFEQVASKVSTRVLLQAWTHFRHRNEPRALRVFFPKGNVGKAFGIENDLGRLAESSRKSVVALCREVLLSRFAELDPLGSVFVDPRLRSYTVAMAPRSASKSLRTLSRGTRIPLPDEGKDTARFFLWWKEGRVDGAPTGRVDIDLAAVMYDADWNFKEHIAYTNLRSQKYRAAHSGDITSAPDGACEFIDIDLPSVKKHGGRYITFSVFSYTRQRFARLPECFAGWMMRKKPKSGEVFEPSTVVDKIDLASDTTISIPIVLDVVARELLWCDLALTRRPFFGIPAASMGIEFRPGNNVPNNMRGMALMGRAMTSLVAPRLYDLFCLHAQARGTLVKDRADADVTFGVEEGITPFDRERIATEFL